MKDARTADAELAALIAIARRAGERVAELYEAHLREGIEVTFKSPGDPVTAADREANEWICAALADRFADAAVIAEESAPKDAAELGRLVAVPRVFYVDPLDGTREFVDGNGEFAVMIGLAERGGAVAGVVHLPATGDLLAGRVGQGAFIEARDGSTEALAVSATERFDVARMLVSRSHRPPLIEPLCRRLGIRTLVPCGSVGVKVARLARGQADLYVHAGLGMKRWDTCAPEAILRAAGGKLTDLDGAPIDYASPDLLLRRGLVATNGVLHPGVLSATGWAEREAARLGG